MNMAKKKDKKQENIDLNDIQKRMYQYGEACDRVKKGKAAALSMIGISILCLIILLVVSLKLSGIGFTAVVDGNSGEVSIVESGNAPTEALAKDIIEN